MYTGDGKGKTTAALGLIIRMFGKGGKVCLIQFLKVGKYCEHKTLRELESVDIYCFGRDRFIDLDNPSEKDRDIVEKGFDKAREIILSKEYDLVILDEINVVAGYGLLDIEKVLALLKEKPERTELVLTGRNAPDRIIESADLVTEMKKIKHYYDNGVEAREGIEM